MGMHVSEDGKKIYIVGGDDTRSIYLYKLSTAYDLSSTVTLTKQRLNLYSNPYTTSQNYDTLTETRYYGSGPLSDAEGVVVSKDGTNILIATSHTFSEFKLPC